MTDQPRVLVTGASGYIAMHCIHHLLEQGYRVRGTLRSLDKADRVRSAFTDVLTSDEQLAFVAANLLSDDGWADAVRGCDYVLHVASPISSPGKDEEAFIRPAVDGTRRVLAAAHAEGVRRVVVTSSVAAIANYSTFTPGTVWDESHWSDPAVSDPYSKSKHYAEKAAWEFVAENPGFEVATINPAFVIGPLFDARASESLRVVSALLKREYPAMPRLGFNIVDVRDVAAAHVLAMTNPDAVGKRFILSNGFIWAQNLAKLLNKHFAAEGYKAPTATLPDVVFRVIGLFDPTAKAMTPLIGKEAAYSNEQVRTVLGLELRPIEQSIVDTGRSLIDTGAV